MKPEIPFEAFPKIPRWSKETVVVTEKIDGTNAQVHITEDGQIRAGSRNRWITPEDDNFGFARWVKENEAELSKLGPGSHFGEWWGLGIQRGYGLKEKRFSLFNSYRWSDERGVRPACCGVVPLIQTVQLEALDLKAVMDELLTKGSRAAPGFMCPEGVVVYLTASDRMFKKLLDNDSIPKSLVKP